MERKKLTIILAVVAFFGVLYFFFQRAEDSSEEMEVTVVTSFYPLYALAEEIGEGRAEVINLTAPGRDPRHNRLSGGDMRMIREADILIYNGAGLEPWAENIEEELKEEEVEIVDMSSYFRTVSREDGIEDPYIWLDFLMLNENARIILNKLIEVDEDGEEHYRENAKSAFAYLEELHTRYRVGLSDCRFNTVKVSEDNLRYMERRYGFNTRIVERGGDDVISINTAKSPSRQELEEKDLFSIMRDNLRKLRERLDCR